jgi:hypothetical protein
MKKRTTLLLLVLSLHCVVFSQTETSFIGKWIFKDVADKEKIDATSLGMLKQFFGNFSIYLKSNHHFKMMMMKQQEGTWSYSEADNKLALTDNNGKVSNMTVVLRDTNTMVFSFEKDKSLVLEKTTVTAADEAETAVKPQALTAASPAQLSKKWYFQNREKPNTSAELLKISNNMFKGTYFSFNSNKSYHVKLGSIEEDGTWLLENNNTNLALSADGNKKIWQIKTINATTLVLIKGNSEEVWTFTTTP